MVEENEAQGMQKAQEMRKVSRRLEKAEAQGKGLEVRTLELETLLQAQAERAEEADDLRKLAEGRALEAAKETEEAHAKRRETEKHLGVAEANVKYFRDRGDIKHELTLETVFDIAF